MSQPISVLLINLDRRPDRLSAVTAQLRAHGIAFERISAIDGLDAAEADLAQVRDNGPIGPLSRGMRACTASHLKAWRHLLQSGADHALILEDDVEIHPLLPGLLTDDAWFRGQADVLKLEKFNPDRPSRILASRAFASLPGGIGVMHRMLSRHTGAAAYIISRRGAEIALGFAGAIRVPIDHLLFNRSVSPLFSRLSPVIAVPPLAWQSAEVGQGSNLAQPEPRPDLRKRLGRLGRSLRRGWHDVRLLPRSLGLILLGRAQTVTLTTPLAKGRAVPAIWRRLARP